MKNSVKKTLALFSILACTTFSVMLANAETGDTSSSSDMSSSESMSGTAGEQMTGEGTTSEKQAGEAPQAMGEEHWKTAKSCTIDGKTYKRGQKGFSRCVDRMKEREQMGGQAPSDTGMMDQGSMDTGASDTSGSYGTSGSSS